MTAGDEQIAVIEAGISRKGRCSHSERIVRPDIGIIRTSATPIRRISYAGRKGRRELNLFAHTPTIIYNAGDPLLLAPRFRPAIPTGS